MFPRSVLPRGMSPREFGFRLLGRGELDARKRLEAITREELIGLQLTPEKVELIRAFYERQALQRRGLPTSTIRAELMEKCLRLLRDG